MITCLTSAALTGTPHGFLGRTGGVSGGLYESLNVGLGSHDDQDHVHSNRALAVGAVLPHSRLVTLHQTHSTLCVTAAVWEDDSRPHADAVITDQPGLLLGILTADCAPVLLADRTAGVVGAAHSGWKGALGNILASTVAAMTSLGADPVRIRAAVGPCIARRSYEVDDGFRQRFEASAPETERFFSSSKISGKHQFDLEGCVVWRLAEAGVGQVEALGVDTYANADQFFSYRRSTHAHEPDYGRQLSVIGLNADHGSA